MIYWKFTLSLLITSLFALYQVQAQDCEVLIEAIAGSYEGDCKKGLANGNGTAKGVDTYEGIFKKGLPHGEGKYIWANGDFFIGEFKKGQKEGAGTLTSSTGKEQVGYWVDDEYIGTEKTPYAVINRDISITRISFRRLSSEGQKIDFKFTRLGKPVKGRNLNPQGFGVLMNETDFVKTVQVNGFPMQGGVSFEAMGQRSNSGGGGGDYVGGNCEIRISQPGYWEVTFEMQATN